MTMQYALRLFHQLTCPFYSCVNTEKQEYWPPITTTLDNCLGSKIIPRIAN